MPTNLLPVLAYVLISTFTPGPSNITSTSLAVLHGYKKTLNYQGGLAVGVFLLMLVSGGVSTTLLHRFPLLEPVLRSVGAAYIFYLAFGILKASYIFADKQGQALGFGHGLLLQVLNPKLIVYAFTLFAGFLTPLTNNRTLVVAASALLAAISFVATSAWALFGAAIQRYLHNPRLTMVINVLLALALVYAAFSLIGLA